VEVRRLDPDEESLTRLMIEYQAGRMEAFERLYALLSPLLARHLEAVARGGAARDLVQETFLEMHRSRHTYLPPLPVRPWAFGIARNVLRRHWRVSAKHRLEIAGGDAALGPAPAAAHPSGADARDLGDALRALPPGRRRPGSCITSRPELPGGRPRAGPGGRRQAPLEPRDGRVARSSEAGRRRRE
jgi:RNA polymerase sigma-70 factor (ECF subfamily)